MIILALALQAATTNLPNMVKQPNGVDFSNMSIEDAVSTMFQMISKDANADLRGMLSDLDQQRKQKAAMREAENEMAKEMQRLKAISRASADAQSNPVAQGQIAWARQLPALCGNVTGEDRGRCLERQVRTRTAELRKVPTPQ